MSSNDNENKGWNDRDFMPVSVHEYDMARMERTIKRLWIVLILTIVCLVGSNLAWTIYENDCQDVVITQEADTWNGGSNYMNGTGEFSYGTREADN